MDAAQQTLFPLLTSTAPSDRIPRSIQNSAPATILLSHVWRPSAHTTAEHTAGIVDGPGLRRHLPTHQMSYALYLAVLVRRLAPLLHASTGFRLHLAVQRTFVLKLPNVLGTETKRGSGCPLPPGRLIPMNLAESRGPRLRTHRR